MLTAKINRVVYYELGYPLHSKQLTTFLNKYTMKLPCADKVWVEK